MIIQSLIELIFIGVVRIFLVPVEAQLLQTITGGKDGFKSLSYCLKFNIFIDVYTSYLYNLMRFRITMLRIINIWQSKILS